MLALWYSYPFLTRGVKKTGFWATGGSDFDRVLELYWKYLHTIPLHFFSEVLIILIGNQQTSAGALPSFHLAFIARTFYKRVKRNSPMGKRYMVRRYLIFFKPLFTMMSEIISLLEVSLPEGWEVCINKKGKQKVACLWFPLERGYRFNEVISAFFFLTPALL